MLEKRTYGSAADDNGTAESLERYIYSNHLQSASLELDETGAIISYEEYHPYGTTSYQAMNASINATAKRYRYTGKEKDEESGLYYHGARYYVPWLCRWTACDPLESKYARMSPYNYSFNNPVMFNDPSGMEPDDPPKEGHTYNVKFEDARGNPIDIPEGTQVPFNPFRSGGDGDPIYTVFDPFKGHKTLTAGRQVISEAEEGAATINTDLTYRYHWGVNEGNLTLVKADQTFSRSPNFRQGTQTTVEPVIGMIDEINLNIPFQPNTNTSNGARFADPPSAQEQISALANQLQNMGVNNIDLQVTSTYTAAGVTNTPNYNNAAGLLSARFNTASNAFSSSGISVNRPANFTDQSLYGKSLSMTVQIPPTLGVIGWNVTSQTVQQKLDAYGNAIGSVSIKHGGVSSTSFVPNKFDSTIPTGGTIWQSIPKSKTFRSLWVIPPVIKLR